MALLSYRHKHGLSGACAACKATPTSPCNASALAPKNWFPPHTAANRREQQKLLGKANYHFPGPPLLQPAPPTTTPPPQQKQQQTKARRLQEGTVGGPQRAVGHDFRTLFLFLKCTAEDTYGLRFSGFWGSGFRVVSRPCVERS